jgi:hypothetical protein
MIDDSSTCSTTILSLVKPPATALWDYPQKDIHHDSIGPMTDSTRRQSMASHADSLSSGSSLHNRTSQMRQVPFVGASTNNPVDPSGFQKTFSDSLSETFEKSLWQVWSGIIGLDEEDDEDKERYDYQDEYKRFRFTPDDVACLVEDDAAFRKLQRSLRKKHCVTNQFLKQTIHGYVKHHKDVRTFRESKMLHQRIASSSAGAKVHNMAV